MPQTIAVIVILILVLGAVAAYLIRAKKRGRKCVGCPCSGQCSGHCGTDR